MTIKSPLLLMVSETCLLLALLYIELQEFKKYYNFLNTCKPLPIFITQYYVQEYTNLIIFCICNKFTCRLKLEYMPMTQILQEITKFSAIQHRKNEHICSISNMLNNQFSTFSRFMKALQVHRSLTPVEQQHLVLTKERVGIFCESEQMKCGNIAFIIIYIQFDVSDVEICGGNLSY